mmetsp:Transcript_5095/g.6614  ORF Transcript_5095/g.6614 Transcript_5095/m.6614 type:complete len:96 (+) Transcript_5095:1952-2239(+)
MDSRSSTGRLVSEGRRVTSFPGANVISFPLNVKAGGSSSSSDEIGSSTSFGIAAAAARWAAACACASAFFFFLFHASIIYNFSSYPQFLLNVQKV